MRRLQPLWLALALLTTLPVAGLVRAPVTPAQQGRSVLCYPLVGLLLGGALALAAILLAGVTAPLGAALLLALWVGLTGALHLDGLADCTDAWFAGHREGHDDGQLSLQVMKDPAAGPMGVTALVLVLLLKFAALLALWPRAAGALLAALVLARCAGLGLMLTTRYRRSSGLASAIDPNLPVVTALGIGALVLVAGALAWPVASWLVAVLAAAVCTCGWRAIWQRRIGGYTGDVVGGLIECVETTVLLVAALTVIWR